MNAVFQLTDCCRTCLSIESTLTSFTSLDTDNIKLSDKLADLISGIDWFKPNSSTLICSSCLEKLRTAYDFRQLCLQSENETQQIYTNLDDYELENSVQIQNVIQVPNPTLYLHMKQGIEEGFAVATRSVKTQTQPLPRFPAMTPAAAWLENQLNKSNVVVDSPLKFSCSVCEKKYAKNANLKIHMRTHTGEKPFECKYCEKRFHHSSHLREHIRRHMGEKPYQCTVCLKRFTITAELKVHMRIHTGEKPYACTICDKRYIKTGDLQVHLRSHTGERPFPCFYCDKRFASNYILNSHLKTHTGDRPWECKVCKKRFTQSSHLTVHSKKHISEKFSCTVCNEEFSDSSQLTIHMLEHTNKSFFVCNICDKIFNCSEELNTHIIEHTDIAKSSDVPEESDMILEEKIIYICSVCDQTFTKRMYLNKHITTYKHGKPLGNELWEIMSLDSSSKLRMKKRAGEKAYTCNICKRRFDSGVHLSIHLRKHKKYIVE